MGVLPLEAFYPVACGQTRLYFRTEAVRALSAELNRSGGKKKRKLVVYATDLECNHLSKNLAELGIKKVDAG